MRRIAAFSIAITASLLTAQAHANLILNTGVTGSFNGGLTGADTMGNDWSGKPAWLYFGQLRATANGVVDFYYVGNEAAFTNTLWLGATTGAPDASHSTSGLPDVFSSVAGASLLGSVGVTANGLVDFGFCTDGGNDTGTYDRCAWNTIAASLTQQFNYSGMQGYRSIGYRALLPGGGWAAGSGGEHAAWGLFWDDSGANNDDNHDDYIAIARFRPVAVPEPTTLLLLGAGLVGLGLSRRRRAA